MNVGATNVWITVDENYLNAPNPVSMNVHIFLGSVLFILGSIQMLPWVRRRAAECGLSGSVAIPFIFVCIGFVTFMIGVMRGYRS